MNMTESFFDRHESYKEAYNYKILNNLPVIIQINGRNFSRLTKKLSRPYCKTLLNILSNTLYQSILEIEGAVFGFQYSDDFIFVLKNDRNPEDQPWYQNCIQKIASVSSSIISVNFLKNVLASNIELDGDPIFESDVFAVPSIGEAINHLILKQKLCINDAIYRAAQAEFTNQYGKDKAIKLLHGKKIPEKLDLLYSNCEIDYQKYYPSEYRLGIAVYKIPMIIRTKDEDISRKKWVLDFDIPDFLSDRNFLTNIIRSGHDVFRAERDLIIQN